MSKKNGLEAVFYQMSDPQKQVDQILDLLNKYFQDFINNSQYKDCYGIPEESSDEDDEELEDDVSSEQQANFQINPAIFYVIKEAVESNAEGKTEQEFHALETLSSPEVQDVQILLQQDGSLDIAINAHKITIGQDFVQEYAPLGSSLEDIKFKTMLSNMLGALHDEIDSIDSREVNRYEGQLDLRNPVSAASQIVKHVEDITKGNFQKALVSFGKNRVDALVSKKEFSRQPKEA